MKLINIKNRCQLDPTPDNTSLIVIGRQVEDGKYNGFYVQINLPFKRYKEYIDPDDFETKMGYCVYKCMLLRRRCYNDKSYKFYTVFNGVWCPLK